MINYKSLKDGFSYETSCGTVTMSAYGNKLRILYGNVVIDQSLQEFKFFLKMINNLYSYILDVNYIYYRRFLIRWKEYHAALALNSEEIREMYDLLGGANGIIEMENMIENLLKNERKP